MRRFWCKDEWSKGFFDTLLIFGNKRGYGWSDKICHCFLHFLIIIVAVIIFHRSLWLAIVISEGWGIGWEVLDWLRGIGASKFDLTANNIGMIMGIIFVLLGGQMIFGYYNQPHFLIENLWKRATEYLYEVIKEEGLFRILLLGILLMFVNSWIAIGISAMVFGLLHFMAFKWQMVLASFILGIVLGIVFVLIPNYTIAYLVCIVIHFVIGMIAITTRLTERWLK